MATKAAICLAEVSLLCFVRSVVGSRFFQRSSELHHPLSTLRFPFTLASQVPANILFLVYYSLHVNILLHSYLFVSFSGHFLVPIKSQATQAVGVWGLVSLML